MELHIPQEVMDKVMFWVNRKDLEVSGFGKIIHDPLLKTFTVVDVYLLKQEVGAAHTDINDESLARLMYAARAVEGELAWWWHSHVKMDVFWSGQDRSTINELGSQGWIVASVFNQREEIRSALCYKAKVRTESEFGNAEHDSPIMVDDLKTFILNAREEDERHVAWAKDYDDMVSEEKPVFTGTGWGKDHRQGLTPDEWDAYTASKKHNTVDAWRKDNPKSLTSLITTSKKDIEPVKSDVGGDDDVCPLCSEWSHYCVCIPGVDKSDARYDDGPFFGVDDPGLMNYGVKKEAAALGMNISTYLAILNDDSGSKDHKTLLYKLEDKLDLAIRNGKLV